MLCHAQIRSNPGTPTQVRRPDFIYVNQQQPGLTYYDFPMQTQQNQMMMHQQQSQTGLPMYPNGSPQRRFLSEGELLARTTSNGLSIGNELSYVNRTNNTVDNIRELAGSPQRGVYNWKDNSPPSQQQINNMSSNIIMGRPPLPNQQSQTQQQYIQNQNINMNMSMTGSAVTPQQQQQPQQQPNIRQSNVSNIINNIVANSSNTTGYHPPIRGGVQVFPPQINASPQVKRKQTPTRPISFVRALEMANSIEMTNVQQQQQNQQQQQPNDQQLDVNKSINENSNIQQQMADHRGSVYDMGVNYEISV